MSDLTIARVPGNQPGTRVLKLAGPFTLSTVFEFQNTVREEAAPITIVDLTDVPYMDSAALGSILGLHVSCQRDGRSYWLVGASDRLRTLFKVAGVDGLLNLCASVSEVESQLGKSAAIG
jgi:anti-sigma B factor antagonist